MDGCVILFLMVKIYVVYYKEEKMEKTTALLITIFVGEFGIHRFMTGKIGTGIIWLLTGGCFGIGWILDIVKVANGSFEKKDGTPWVIG